MVPNGPHCPGCILEHRGSGFMKVDGKGHSGVMLVAEALGKNEARHNLAFIGAAGFLLRNVLHRIVKAERDDFWLANTIFCRPPNDYLRGAPWEHSAINHCRPHLDAAIQETRPKVIVPLGDIALRRVLGLYGIKKYRGYAYWSDAYECWVVPSWHPSHLLRGQHRLQPVLGFDIRKAMKIAAAVGTKEPYTHEVPTIICEPTTAEMGRWTDGYLKALGSRPQPILAFDIETDYKAKKKDESTIRADEDPSFNIRQISFCYQSDEDDSVGIALEWCESLMPFIKAVLATEGPKVVWNRPYDVPRIKWNGVPIHGHIRDTMVAWHTLHSDLDRGLGSVTPYYCPRFAEWKTKSNEDGGWFYSGMDSVSLHRNDAGIMQKLEEDGIMTFFRECVEGPRPVLTEMEDAGMLMDRVAQADLSQRMLVDLTAHEAEMQALVPQVLRNIEPKEGFVRDPEDTTGMRRVSIPNQTWTVCPKCKLRNPTKPHFKQYKAKRFLHKNTPCSGLLSTKMAGDDLRWARVLPFRPSTAQMIRYCEHKKFLVPVDWKSGNSTMDSKAMNHLIAVHAKDKLLPLVLTHRSVKHMYGMYGGEGLHLDENDRVHTTFTDNPNTFRFASEGPNMQNIPRPGEMEDIGYASEIRNLFIARPGWILGARDYTGIEAVLVGYFAGDRDYVRLAKLGVHDYFNAHRAYEAGEIAAADLPDLSWPDDQLGECLAEFKVRLKDSRPVAKSCVHGGNYLETAYWMHKMGKGLYASQAAAQRVLDQYFELFPKIPLWHENTCQMADRQGYLTSPYGFPLRFYQVYTYEKDPDTLKWVKKLGDSAKKSVAFRPQHTAAVIMRLSIVRAGEDEFLRQYLRLTIHDELMTESPESIYEEVDEHLRVVMEAPQTALKLDESWGMGEYLTIGTDSKFGQKWGQMS